MQKRVNQRLLVHFATETGYSTQRELIQGGILTHYRWFRQRDSRRKWRFFAVERKYHKSIRPDSLEPEAPEAS